MSAKIAIFIPSMEAGGAERVAISLMKGFLQRKIHLDLVLVSASGPLLVQVPKGVRIVNLNVQRTLFSICRLSTYLKKEQPDALISFLNHANLIAVVAGRLAGFKGHMMITEHNSIQFDVIRRGGFKNKTIFLLMRLLYKHADSVVAVSNELLSELQTLLVLKNAVCINNPVDNPKDVDAVDKNDEQHLPAMNQGKGTILAIGRLAPQKNFPLLIKSIAIVRKHMPVKLHILGNGSERRNLENMINELELSEVVFLRGYSDQPEKWLRQSDLFVLSSSWEGFGLVIVEALAMGVTVVATDCPSGPAEILENGKYGYLVPINDPEKMAEAILYALKNPRDPELLKKRAEDFSIPRITKQYLNVIFSDG